MAAPWSITAAAGEGEEEGATWWDGGGGDGRGTDDANGATGAAMVSNPFGEYVWPAANQGWEARGYGRGETGATGWELTAQQEGDGAEEWVQEWDEGSQSYYWYNRLTGESQW